MDIYINGRFLFHPCTGVERYSYELCRAMHNSGSDFTIICPKSGEIRKEYDVSGMKIVRYGVGSSHLWEQFVLPIFFIGKHDYLIISFMGLGPVLIPNKVITIHDLSFLHNKSWFSKRYYYYYRLLTPLAARTSKHIITVSEFSKKEIHKYYGFLSNDDISVIYNAPNHSKCGNNSGITENCRESYEPGLYILAVSSIDPRKNFKTLLKAFVGMNDCHLKIVGTESKAFRKTVRDNTSGNIEWLGRVDDEKLFQLYHNAAAFISPSLYEGFGLPLIEAMSSGCPVLASDIDVFREVCGDSAIYFNPNSAHDIENKMRVVLSMDEAERMQMIEKGQKNAMRFSWESSANKLINTLKSIYE